MTAGGTDGPKAAFHSAQSLIASLQTMGVSRWVICPGSRSTPLALAIAKARHVDRWVLIDERSAGFFAVGMAKCLGEPVGVVCTSGTAAANLLPAVVEASYSNIPLVVVTADRPAEMRGTGALQTIDQSNLFGPFIRWSIDLPAPIAGDDHRETWSVINFGVDAVAHATGSRPGPVHINAQFRDPFIPEPSLLEYSSPPMICIDLRPASPPVPDAAAVQRVAEAIRQSKRGVIVAGAEPSAEVAHALASLARCTGFPLLADPLSQLRSASGSGAEVIDGYDLILRSAKGVKRLAPDVVLRFGATPTSKPLMAFLSTVPRDRQISIHAEGLPNDPQGECELTVAYDVGRFVDLLVASLEDFEPTDSRRPWNSVAGAVRPAVSLALHDLAEVSEPSVVAALADSLPTDSILWVGASMPLRDMDGFFPRIDREVRILGNRGVNGIDGVVSSALGAGAGSGRRVTLLIGDVSFAHDLHGLLASRLHGIDATIVLVNNNGGGIFNFLPQARYEGMFETYFGTPTGLDFEPLVGAYGGKFLRPDNIQAFRDCLTESWDAPGLTVIEVNTDRAANVQTHEHLWQVAVAAADAAVDALP